ncbi:MAG TPA: histidine phosphatase family protein [Candidatus Dormibacteraeota bacterium]|jgi:probable phosphoglycerate mutase|nr:histidine phosphatase family protein [Candidatus Dormibacteraeota bacterium]
MPTTRIYLTRHADVENPDHILYGYLPTFRLSALGRAQAREVGRTLRDAGIVRIVHSPLRRARETARLIRDQLEPQPELVPAADLREAEFSRYLQGVPYWQVPFRRPLWVVHKTRRGTLPGDESFGELGGRVLDVIYQQTREHPGEPVALVSHADPIQAAWILLDGAPQKESEMLRHAVAKGGRLEVDMEGTRLLSIRYVEPPKVTID